jgi:hypothetical protein
VLKNLFQRLSYVAAATFFVFVIGGSAFGQTLYESFTDGDFTATPVWTGTNATWTIVPDSDVAAGAPASSTLRLNAVAGTAGTEYLSSQIGNWGVSQEWYFFIGRRAQAATSANQSYFWLYANEANLNSATVDGYRIAFGDDTGNDEIRLEYIVNGALNTAVIAFNRTPIPNDITDFGFLVRVTRSPAGLWQIFTPALPTASGTGNVATITPDTLSRPILQGSGTNNALFLGAGGFMGVAALHTADANALTAAEFDQIYFNAAVPTAATVTVSGRLTTANGYGIGGAMVSIDGGSLSEAMYAQTSPFGYYTFEGIPAGQAYIITVSSKRYTFNPPNRVITVQEDVGNADFVSQE